MTTSYNQFNCNEKEIIFDLSHSVYLSESIRILMRAHSIDKDYKMNNFMRYQYKVNNYRWLTVFDAYSFFSQEKVLIKAYIYGYFNEEDKFIREKMKVRQGQEIENLDKLIKKQKLLPSYLVDSKKP